MDPSFISRNDARYQRSLLKADHYARVFNLIGQKELSRYFDLMGKRIVYDRGFPDFRGKQKLFDKIKTQYIKVSVGERVYFGNVEKLEEKLFIFTGVDENLLSVDTFVDFEGYEDEHVKEGMNDFYVLSDGLCIASLEDVKFIETQIKYEQIPHHFASFSMIDFDYCKDSTILDYVSYLFEKIGCKPQDLPSNLKPSFDLWFTYNEKQIAVEIKRYLNPRAIDSLLERLSQRDNRALYKMLLVTNTRLSPYVHRRFRAKSIDLIDRTRLDGIIRNNETLLRYLK